MNATLRGTPCKALLAACAALTLVPLAQAKVWPGFSRGMGMGGWLTNYKRFNVLPENRRMQITIGDLEHFDTYITERDVENVKAMGFDHIRVGFDQIVLEETPYRYRERTFARLDAFVGWCEKHGLNLVLNLHKAVGNYCDIAEKATLLDDADLQKRFIALWLEIERRYHGRTGVAFELLNEVRDVDPAKWNDLADRTVKALREKNETRWIVVGSTCWNSAGKLGDLKVWDDPRVVYTFHMYAPFSFTHQRGVLQASPLYYNRVMEYPTKDVERYRDYERVVNGSKDGGYPGLDEIGYQYLRNAMHGAHAFALAHPDKILWNGEFGTIRHAPPASRVAYMRDVIAICKEWGIPYCVWNYLSTPNDGNRFSLVDDDTRKILSPDLLKACLGELDSGTWHALDGASLWTHDAGVGTLKTEGPRTWRVTTRGARDWAVSGFGHFPAKPGVTYAFEARAERPAGGEAKGTAYVCCTARDARDNVLAWCWAQRTAKPGHTVRTTFLAPPETATLEPRFVGYGVTDIVLSEPCFLVGRALSVTATPAAVCTASSDALDFAFAASNGTICVTDHRTGRTWRPQALPNADAPLVRNVTPLADGCRATLVDCNTLQAFEATFRLEKASPELVVELRGCGPFSGGLSYPAPFASALGDRLVYPHNEGVSFPVDEPHPVAGRLEAYNGSGLCMAFFGVAEAKRGAGWMTILETADDAAMRTRRDAAGCVSAGPSWDAHLGQFGPARRARYVFFDKGGHVAMCKRYRAYAKAKGLWKPFTEKLKTRPMLDRLFGAINVWCWEGGHVEWVRQLQDAGIRRILWSGGGTPETVRALAANPDVLVGRYDIYTDVYHPEQLKKLGRKSGCNMEAWPNDVIWSGPTSNDWTRAWGVKAKDGTWTHCATLCDMVAPDYCRRNIANDLKTKPFNARFLDVTTAGNWKECHNPRHPMSRAESREARVRLLNVVSGEYGLVTGGETGHDFSVATCDYYEGMLSLCAYRVPDSGRKIPEIWTNAPERVVKYQVGERTRVPLWELVYHDCTCAEWYWGDYNNKLPQLWAKRDLFNVLYGTMGMFFVRRSRWAEERDGFVRSYKTTSPVARATATSEMTDHRALTDDWSVQRTTFANGVTVTVNFGDAPWTDADGSVVAARTHVVKGLPAEK